MGRRGSPTRLKKSLGQVFLKETWPIERVTEKLGQWRASRILEIGPGGGILTRGLLDKGLKVTAIEKDDRFAERLEDYKRTSVRSSSGELEVVHQDVLKFSLEDWLQKSKEPTAIVGNIPYNISSSILLWSLPYLSQLKGLYFMVQLEFAQRLAAISGTKSYGSLSVFTQLRSRVQMECKVDRTCFVPKPKVDSALVSLVAPSVIYSEKLLKHTEHVSRLAFQQRRKKLVNAVSSLLEQAPAGRCPIDLHKRPDSLRPEEYVELARYFFPEDA